MDLLSDADDEVSTESSSRDNYSLVPMDISETEEKTTVGGTEKRAIDEQPKNESINQRENYAVTDMVLSPAEKKKKQHMVLCPVCYEIAILDKSNLYGNLIIACMKQYNSVK